MWQIKKAWNKDKMFHFLAVHNHDHLDVKLFLHTWIVDKMVQPAPLKYQHPYIVKSWNSNMIVFDSRRHWMIIINLLTWLALNVYARNQYEKHLIKLMTYHSTSFLKNDPYSKLQGQEN